VRNPKVGYCQSLNFIGATALLFLPEPSAFWLLAAMAENLLQVYHTRQMTMLQVDVRVLQQLVEEKVRGGVFFFGGEFEIGSMLHTHTHSSQEFCLYLRGLISEFVCAFFFFFFFFFFLLQIPTLAAHLQANGLGLNLVCTPWFLTVFTTGLPIESCLRVWDALFSEGAKIMFRVGISILKINQPARAW
jgi:hypothetical protein